MATKPDTVLFDQTFHSWPLCLTGLSNSPIFLGHRLETKCVLFRTVEALMAYKRFSMYEALILFEDVEIIKEVPQKVSLINSYPLQQNIKFSL